VVYNQMSVNGWYVSHTYLSILRKLATDWMVWGSNPGPHRLWGPPSLLCDG